jgi:hypothetical protein
MCRCSAARRTSSWCFTSIAQALRHHHDVMPTDEIERGVAICVVCSDE